MHTVHYNNAERHLYRKMMKIVKAAGYHGYVGVEYEGTQLKEADGIIATKKLLKKVFAEMAKG